MLSACLLGYVARVAYLSIGAGLDAPLQYDEVSYQLLAESLLAGRGFGFDGVPTAFRPPGYPVFLAAIYGTTGSSPGLVRLLQAALGPVLIALTFLVSMRAFRSPRAAVLAALIVAVHPVLIYLSARLLSETLMLVLAMAAVSMMMQRPRGFRPWELGLFSLLLGALVLVRPALLLLALFACLWFVAALPDKRRGVQHAGIVLLVLFMFVGAWTVRNHLRFGEFIPLATEGGVTFWGGNHPMATGGVVEPSPETWQWPDPPVGLRGWPQLTERQSESRFYSAAFAWIREHPDDFMRLLPKKVARAWTLSFGNEAREASWPGWLASLYVLFPLLGLIGLVLSARAWRRLWPLYGLLIASTLITLLFYGSTRQTAVLIPTAAIFVAYALDRALDAMNDVARTYGG